MKTMNMKLIKKSLLIIASVGFLGLWSCQEWNKMDSPAGNQVIPRLVMAGEHKFETDFPDDAILASYDDGQDPEIVNDEFKGNVLQIEGGYVRYNSPLENVKLQTGASLTMWFKTTEDNLNGAIFSFTNEDESERLFFTPNAWLRFESVDDEFEINNPSSTQTNVFSPDEWLYLAISINRTGYFIYIDGEKIYEEVVDDFDFSKIVDSFNHLPYFYIGYGSPTPPKNMWVDDVRIYRNVITSKEITVPVVSEVGEPYQFPPRGTVGYFKLDGTFTNSLNKNQDGELITVKTQATPSGFEEDAERGLVWHQQEGWDDHANGWAYTRFDNPLKSKTTEEGVSVSLWINPPVMNWWDQIFVLNDGTSKFWFNAIGYLGYNGEGGWFDCQNNNADNALEVGKWTFVTINITTSGFQVYYNGELKFDKDNNAGYGGDLTDFSHVINMFTTANDFYLGNETWWRAAPALVDDIFLITRSISEAEVKSLYSDTQKTNGGIISNPTYLPSLFGYYPLNNSFNNALNTSQSGELITVETQATPSAFEEDTQRGTVWHQQEGWDDNANGWAYTRFDNPLKGKTAEEGISVSMWLNPPVLNFWDQIFVLNDGTSKFWFNAIGYLGYNGTGGFFDCHNNNADNALGVGVWTLVTINVLPDGFEVYYNGQLKFDKDNNAGYGGDLEDFNNVVNMFLTADDFFFGYESWWKAAPALIDDVYLCASPLSAKQAEALYNATIK